MNITRPTTDAEFAACYELRWQVLRAPWNQPRGAERDELEAVAEHAVIWDDDGVTPLAVGRLHFNSPEEAQIRSMAVQPNARGRGLGRAIVEYLEAIARRQGARCVILSARLEAEGFYAKLGYEPVGAGPTLFGAIPHTKMAKQLDQPPASDSPPDR